MHEAHEKDDRIASAIIAGVFLNHAHHGDFESMNRMLDDFDWTNAGPRSACMLIRASAPFKLWLKAFATSLEACCNRLRQLNIEPKHALVGILKGI